MTDGKHGPNSLSNFLAIHEKHMREALDSGFALSDGIIITPESGAIRLTGTIECIGGIYVDVNKTLRVVSSEGPLTLVQTAIYSYNVVLHNVGNIFRYDSPHETGHPQPFAHHLHHHVHRYDLESERHDCTIEIIADVNNVPHLSDVMDEAREWYYKHMDLIARLTQ